MQYSLIFAIYSMHLSYNHVSIAHEINMMSENLETHMIAPNSKQKL